MPNRFLPLRSGTDMDQLLAILNKNFGELDGETITKVFSVSQSNPGFIQGKLPNGLGYGFLMYTPDNKVAIACYIDANGQPVLRVAKEGFDAVTGTNDQLIFNSAQNIFKIVDTDTATINVPSSADDFSDSITIDHNLGFVPSYDAYLTPPPGFSGFVKRTKLPFFDYVLFDSFTGADAGWHINGLGDVNLLTDTQIRFRLSFVNGRASIVGDWTFTYYLQQESLS